MIKFDLSAQFNDRGYHNCEKKLQAFNHPQKISIYKTNIALQLQKKFPSDCVLRGATYKIMIKIAQEIEQMRKLHLTPLQTGGHDP